MEHRERYEERCRALSVKPSPTAYLFSYSPTNDRPCDPSGGTHRYGRMVAHDAAIAEDDQHREITDDDMIEDAVGYATLAGECDDDQVADVEQAGSDWRDLREEAAAEPVPMNEDVVRVPDVDETAASVRRAGRGLDEIAYRDSSEDQHDNRGEVLARWHADDYAAASAAYDHASHADEAN